ncbi:hypothetical protein ALC53_09525 [Atta colombica]|uniref:Uncharacterized protein n=1 Tax=Atta colombica TaxID=520822 RepID=A0A195B726_9HYME|nr:hypothetical protein ALC53_09525 [Atta colombica]
MVQRGSFKGLRCFCDYGFVSHEPSKACLFPPNLTGKCVVMWDTRLKTELEVKLRRLLSRSRKVMQENTWIG